MGYTNYWHQYNDFTDEEWKSILEEYDYIKEVCGDIIKDETTDLDRDTHIIFNGIGSNIYFIIISIPIDSIRIHSIY